jgi:hypothetical protein
MKISHLAILAASIAALALPAAAGAAPLTFEQAAAKATSTKGCPKKMVDVIETVEVLKDPGAKGLYLSVCDAACPSSKLTGPLAAAPSAAQLESLKGRPLCLAAD